MKRRVHGNVNEHLTAIRKIISDVLISAFACQYYNEIAVQQLRPYQIH